MSRGELRRNPLHVLIAGGSFQGKSLVALEVAHRLRVPLIICTDTVRNVLRVMQPRNEVYSTSTYLMNPSALAAQCEAVSDVILGITRILQDRGERAVFEGMHFSESLLRELASRQNFRMVCLDNLY